MRAQWCLGKRVMKSPSHDVQTKFREGELSLCHLAQHHFCHRVVELWSYSINLHLTKCFASQALGHKSTLSAHPCTCFADKRVSPRTMVALIAWRKKKQISKLSMCLWPSRATILARALQPSRRPRHDCSTKDNRGAASTADKGSTNLAGRLEGFNFFGGGKEVYFLEVMLVMVMEVIEDALRMGCGEDV